MSFYKIFQTKENGEALLTKSYSTEIECPIFTLTYLSDVTNSDALAVVHMLPVDPDNCDTQEEFLNTFNEVFSKMNKSTIQQVIDGAKKEKAYISTLDETRDEEEDNIVAFQHQPPSTKQ